MKIYLVGGAVRDKLLGRQSVDTDYVVVGATQAELEERFGKSVGESFPVYLDKETGAEYAMARREKKTGPGYMGFTVEFGPDITLEEDLKRRDFTMNALAMDLETGEIVDCFGGQKDLENGIIRHTSEAFAEDPLRVLRAARYQSRYNFKLDYSTRKLCEALIENGNLNELPYARYWRELEKVMDDAAPQNFFYEIGELDRLRRINFFNDVFKGRHLNIADNVERVARVTNDGDTRLAYTVALAGMGELEKVDGITTLMLELHGAVQQARGVRYYDDEPKIWSLVFLMKHLRVSQPGDLFDHFLNCVRADKLMDLRVGDFKEIRRYFLSVRAQQFIDRGLKGADIGEGMKQTQFLLIEELMKGWQ